MEILIYSVTVCGIKKKMFYLRSLALINKSIEGLQVNEPKLSKIYFKIYSQVLILVFQKCWLTSERP